MVSMNAFKNKIKETQDKEVCITNLAKVFENIISGNELLHARRPQNYSKYRIQSRFGLRLLSKNFASKKIEIL